MKTLIIRKPKFMRSDNAMEMYLYTAHAISKTLEMPDLSSDEQYDILKKMGECMNRAAKAGGFLSTKDFLKWLEIHKRT